MKINKLYFLFLVYFIVSCNLSAQKEDELMNIQTAKTENHIRVAGTKVFLDIPSDYHHIKEMARYQKKKYLYFQVQQFPQSIYDWKKGMQSRMATVDTSKVIFKDIKVNGLDGVFMQTPHSKGKSKIGITFGTDSEYVMIVCICDNEDVTGKNELIDILKTTYYDESYDLDPMELVNFEFDQSISKFKLANSNPNMLVFNPYGKRENPQEMTLAITFVMMPKMLKNNAYGVMQKFVARSEHPKLGNRVLKSKELTELKINDYPAVLLDTEFEYEGEKWYMYQILLVGEKSTLLFMGQCERKRMSKYRKIFKKTVESIKLRK